MAFQEQEKKRLADYAREQWGETSHVIPYEIANETLQADVRASALDYFRRHAISWWTGKEDQRVAGMEARPTGHLNSSQVACVNHLEAARLDRDVARIVLDNLGLEAEPEQLDDGYVEYEWIGRGNYLGEARKRTRGANVTSLDAMMLGVSGERRVLVVIEWKYLETYSRESVAVSRRKVDRVATYRSLLSDPDCPIAVSDLRHLFYEPYYQLMRQTLLAWQMVIHQEFDATDWTHVQVIPAGNVRLRGRGGAPNSLHGRDLAEVWASVLHRPDRYQLLSPTDVVRGTESTGVWNAWRSWLARRYLT